MLISCLPTQSKDYLKTRPCASHTMARGRGETHATPPKRMLTKAKQQYQGGVSRGRITHPQKLGASHTTKNVHRIAQSGRGASHTTAHHARTLGFGGLEPYAP